MVGVGDPLGLFFMAFEKTNVKAEKRYGYGFYRRPIDSLICIKQTRRNVR